MARRATTASAWTQAKGTPSAVVYERIESAGHNLAETNMNMASFESFLDAVATGVIR